MKRKPKFRVGQVVWVGSESMFLKIMFRFPVAEGVGRGLRWHYRGHTSLQHTREFSEQTMRRLTKRERGE